jgi:septal ring factor EnvC (AmiA/AmiB activator)
MKTRIVFGVGLLATLLLASYVLVRSRVEAQEAQPNEYTDRVRQLSEQRERLENERRHFDDQTLAIVRDLDARQQQLQRELEELAAKRRSLEQRREEWQRRIDNVDRQIQASKVSKGAGRDPSLVGIGAPSSGELVLGLAGRLREAGIAVQ